MYEEDMEEPLEEATEEQMSEPTPKPKNYKYKDIKDLLTPEEQEALINSTSNVESKKIVARIPNLPYKYVGMWRSAKRVKRGLAPTLKTMDTKKPSIVPTAVPMKIAVGAVNINVVSEGSAHVAGISVEDDSITINII